jgi:hypothetical protein
MSKPKPLQYLEIPNFDALLHDTINNGPLIGEYIWSKSDGDITVRKLREQ